MTAMTCAKSTECSCFAPPDAWNSPTDPLHAPVPPVVLPNIRARNALSLILAFLGGPQDHDNRMDDTKSFSLNLPAGSVLDLLNGTVRAHGAIAWAFDPSWL